MGVDFNQYLIVGIKLPNHNELSYEMVEEYLDNGYKKDVIHKNGLSCIYDGMNGKYTVIGRIVYKSDIDQPLEGAFCLGNVDKVQAELIASLISLSFPSIKVVPDDIKQWFVTHYH